MRPGLPPTSAGRQGALATSAAPPPADQIRPRAGSSHARPAALTPLNPWIKRRVEGKPHRVGRVRTNCPPKTGKSFRPQLRRKNLCTCGKHVRTLTINAESPLLGVCHISQSSECPYPSLSTTDTKSPEGCIIRRTHLVRRAILVC